MTIAQLNDNARKTGLVKMVLTSGIVELGDDQVEEIISIVQNYEDFFNFDENNDAHGEHDFGSFDYKNENVFWKIDYYEANSDMQYGTNGADKKAIRVLTIMLAEEY